jgi:hypothetical protein
MLAGIGAFRGVNLLVDDRAYKRSSQPLPASFQAGTLLATQRDIAFQWRVWDGPGRRGQGRHAAMTSAKSGAKVGFRASRTLDFAPSALAGLPDWLVEWTRCRL